MIREIIKIDEEKCDGCGICIPGCPEGALQIIDNKARLVSDLMCDGLGACIGDCPQGAIEIEKREAEMYNETEVIKVIAKQGKNTTIAHLKHLKDHGETGYFNEAVIFLSNNPDQINFNIHDMINEINKSSSSADHPHEHKKSVTQHPVNDGCGCQGAATMDFRDVKNSNAGNPEMQNNFSQPSELKQWPIQMHLINPMAPYFKNCDLLLAADCVAFASGDFHREHLKGRSVAIACPKLDSHLEVYVDKLTSMINDANINTITVMIMEVPCCGGLLQMAMAAVQRASRKIPVKMIKVGIQGEIKAETWM
ncbi:MAG: 4Fe-4S binding protein [Bacteroidetes bacterium]|nr:4Fe-4S binding protein [Bacteroidota bacterium]